MIFVKDLYFLEYFLYFLNDFEILIKYLNNVNHNE